MPGEQVDTATGNLPEQAEPSLRDTITSAFEATEPKETTTPPVTEPPVEEEVPAQQPSEAPPPTPQQEPASTQAQSPIQPADKPPQSWKAGPRGKWATVDPEVRAEVIRREREHDRVLNESAQARNVVGQVMEAVRPYEARMRSIGVGPLEAIQRLFQVDHVLSSSPAPKAAQFMAHLIREYGIDIKELDNALAGQPPVDPVASQIDQALQQRLAPLNQFLQYQQYQQQAADYQRGQVAATEVSQMAQDTAKYPHFEAVRETMADLIDFNSSRGVYEGLDVVYNKSVAMNPELGAQAARQAVQSQAAAVNQRTQRALAASVSVSGSPGGSPTTGQGNGSLRDSIEAAWAAHTVR